MRTPCVACSRMGAERTSAMVHLPETTPLAAGGRQSQGRRSGRARPPGGPHRVRFAGLQPNDSTYCTMPLRVAASGIARILLHLAANRQGGKAQAKRILARLRSCEMPAINHYVTWHICSRPARHAHVRANSVLQYFYTIRQRRLLSQSGYCPAAHY